MRRLVVATIRGGLGNQLFQFAAAKALAVEDSGPVVLDLRHARQWPVSLQDVLLPGAFRAAGAMDLLRLRQLPQPPLFSRTLLAYQERESAPKLLQRWVLREGTPPLDVPRKVLLRGYFQQEEWFNGRAGLIRGCFRPPSARAIALNKSARRKHHPLVAVAVRSGADYRHFNLLTPKSYYLECARLFEHLGPTFVITGDVTADAEDVADHLRAWAHVTVVADESPKVQLDVHALADHAIIANSSFAWWGAWLGDHRNDKQRQVFCPSPWVPGAPTRSPDRWTAVPTVLGTVWH